MKILYKYYSELDFSYFNRPSLKLSPAKNLNDPFEVIIPSELISTSKMHIKTNDPKYKIFKNIKGENANIEDSYQTLFDLCGVISLSETQHNLLMWAHYANQHKGLCIGYSTDILSEMNIPTYSKLPLTTKPMKVNYDCKKTFDYNLYLDFTDVNSIYQSAMTKVLTTKGDDWIYEKEHRFILPLTLTDRIMKIRNRELVLHNDFNSKANKGVSYTEKHRQHSNIILKNIDTDFTFLLDIDPKFILEVYVGCRATDEYFDSLKKYLKKNKYTSHIKTFHFKESSERFEIEIPKRKSTR